MANEEEKSMIYKSMLNKTLGLPHFNQYSYLFEYENGDDTSLLNTPSTDAEMSGTAAEMSGSFSEDLLSATDNSRPTESFAEALSISEPKDIDQMTRRNQQLLNYWESQQKESQLIEEKLSGIRVRAKQNETQWKKEKSRLLSPQSRIPAPGKSSVPTIDLHLETERQKRMELEIQCSALNRKLHELQEDAESKLSASHRFETLKEMQKRQAEEIEEIHKQAEITRGRHAKEIEDLKNALITCRQQKRGLEGEKNSLIIEIEQMTDAQQQHKDEMNSLQKKLQEQNDTRGCIEREKAALELKYKRQSLDMVSLREVVSGKEEATVALKAKLAATEMEKQKLQEAFDVLEDQKQRAEQEIRNLKLQLVEAENQHKKENTKNEIAFERPDGCTESKQHDLEFQFQQLQEDHHEITYELKAEAEVYRFEVADLNEKLEVERDEHLKLRRKLGQLGGFEETNKLKEVRKQEDGKTESVGREATDWHTSFNSEATGQVVQVGHRSFGEASFNASLQNHVTRIETEHAPEIKELLQALGHGQSEDSEWSSQSESRNEWKVDFSNSPEGDLSGIALSPILLQEHSESASTGSNDVERKIDGLLEEIGQMDQERDDLVRELHEEASNSRNAEPSNGSRLIEEPTTVSPKVPNDVSESPSFERNFASEPPSNELLDNTILLLNNLKNLMDGLEKENDKETSVLDQLEALSEMMHGEAHLHSDFLNGSSSGNGSNASAMRTSAHSRVSGRVPSSPLKPSMAHDDAVDVRPLKQKEEIWCMLVAELRHRISLLEHDRNEVVRITGEILERERDSNRFKLQSAMSSARRQAFEEFQSLMEVHCT